MKQQNVGSLTRPARLLRTCPIHATLVQTQFGELVRSRGSGGTDRGRRPGATRGHPGHHRPTPARIDERREHRLKVSPCRGGPLQRCQRPRTRLIEDLPADLHAVLAGHTLRRDYCPKCKKHVEPVVPDALPNATFSPSATSGQR